MATTVDRRTDEQVQRDVLAELARESRVGPNEIGVIVKDGLVTLTGWVDAYSKKFAAREAALRVVGVKAVADEIEVRLPGSARRTDADLAAAARRALEADAMLPAENIEISVSEGVVTLRGVVDTQDQLEEAERVVRSLKGVRGLASLLKIRSWPLPRPSPTDLQQAIEAALVRDAATDAKRIQVAVREDGTVIPTGTMRSWAEREEAERVAWRGAGVTNVDNQITVDVA